MDTHSIPRSQAAARRTASARQLEEQQIEQYLKLAQAVNEGKEKQNHSIEALNLTSQLLAKNPEYYTIWNYRRRILLDLLLTDTAVTNPQNEEQDLLRKDLEFLLPLLKQYPKCYWIWNHRLWLLEQQSARSSHGLAQKAWRDELGLVSLMLTRDRRNFHGWSYRRAVVERLQRLQDKTLEKAEAVTGNAQEQADAEAGTQKEQETPKEERSSLAEAELQYTLKMIKADLSNFSAWHARSKLIPRVLDERQATQTQRRSLFDAELALLKDGLLMDPYDQSLWKYHQYLMFVLLTPRRDSGVASDVWIDFSDAERKSILGAEIEELRELLDDTQDCKWLYQNLLQYAFEYLQLVGSPAAAAAAAVAEERKEIFTMEDLREWLTALKKLDPNRLGRWQDMQRKMDL